MAHLTNSCTVDSPSEFNVKYHANEGSPLPYACHIENWWSYLIMKWLNIAYAVQIVGQFVLYPNEIHFTFVHRIIWDLRGIIDKRFILFLSFPLVPFYICRC